MRLRRGVSPRGLSHRHDWRPEQQKIDSGKGQCSRRSSNRRARSGSAGSSTGRRTSITLPSRCRRGTWRRYKVAWIASCILYDRRKLEAVGGFSFWPRLPAYHSGEEVLVQNLLMRRWGGCGMVPSGTYYSQVPTTVLNDRGSVDGHALDLLPEMVERYARSGQRDRSPAPERDTPNSASPDRGPQSSLIDNPRKDRAGANVKLASASAGGIAPVGIDTRGAPRILPIS